MIGNQNNSSNYMSQYIIKILSSLNEGIQNLPNIKNGAARLIPMKGTPMYIQKPNADTVPIMDEITPNNPRYGLDLTQSVIMHVMTQNAIMNPMFIEKNGMTELVFDSNSRSNVKEVNRNISTSGS